MFERYKKDPVGFVKDILGAAGRPYDKQEEILKAIAKQPRVSVAACNSSGKDWAAARAIVWWLHTRTNAKVVVTGPTRRQIRDILWHELRIAVAAAGDALPGKITNDKYVIDEDRFAIAFSSNSHHNIQGFHSPNLLVIVTEAQGVKQVYMEAIKRLNPTKVLLIGNPLAHEGELYESHHAKSSLYHQITISAFDSPNFRRKRFRIPGLVTPEDVEHHRRDWGADSPLYVASVLGQFPDALEDSLTTRNHVDRAIARHEEQPVVPAEAGTSQPLDERGRSLPYRMGVDVARFGGNESVICIRRGYRVEHLIPLRRGLDNMQVADEVKAWTDALGINAVFADGTGVGTGVVDRLGQLGVPVIGVDVGGKARRPSQFADLRAEIFWEVARLLREDAASIPNDSVLVGQLLALRYDVSSTGRIRLESKTKLRHRGVASPDRADALALAFMEPPSLDIWV
ncbi:MAG: hypothetical protein OXE02_04885 [Chloroflexi bacterium]|nr:hypothetical protein [Chloroflexota bacterium]